MQVFFYTLCSATFMSLSFAGRHKCRATKAALVSPAFERRFVPLWPFLQDDMKLLITDIE